ncbi:MAG TPA: antibiotic biosynthesis monooxygenase family protein [Thermomicrobiales bacterium]|jgi:quinol monooxygenase YgiN
MAHPQHARIGFYTAKPGTLDAVLDRAEKELVPMMQEQPGFRRYTLVRTGPDTVVSLTGWETKEQAEAAAQQLSGWVREVMGPSLTSVENHIAEVVTYTESSTTPPVYGRVTDSQFPSGKTEEVRAKARTDFLPKLQEQPGFIRHIAFRPGPDRTITFMAFASQSALEAAERATDSWRGYVASMATSTKRQAGEIVWSVRKD